MDQQNLLSPTRSDGRLLGWAKDPLSAGRTIQNMLDPGYFGRTGGHVLCFGMGGAGLARREDHRIASKCMQANTDYSTMPESRMR